MNKFLEYFILLIAMVLFVIFITASIPVLLLFGMLTLIGIIVGVIISYIEKLCGKLF